MRRVAICLAVLAGTGACRWSVDVGGAGGRIVAGGTFFNMCIGYCMSALVVEGTTATLTETSHDPESYPRRVRSLELTRDEADRLRGWGNPSRMRLVAGVHGCPDCADGGGEWVEVREAGGQRLRATFDYGRTLAPIEELQEEIRALRARFE